jgi:hypothetical protein
MQILFEMKKRERNKCHKNKTKVVIPIVIKDQYNEKKLKFKLRQMGLYLTEAYTSTHAPKVGVPWIMRVGPKIFL